MNHLTERFSAAFARLAFWRKPAPAADTADAPPGEAPVPDVPPAEAPPPGDAPELIEDASPQTDELPAGEAQAAEPPEELPADRATDIRDEADAAETDPPTKGTRRLFALFSKKIVWIPAASLALLAFVGTLGALLWQSGQDRSALETKLKAAEQRLEQTARPPVPASTTPATPPAPADAETAATAGTASARAAAPRLVPAGGDCDINDVEGVSLRLKDCIDAFNQVPAARARPARDPRARAS